MTEASFAFGQMTVSSPIRLAAPVSAVHVTRGGRTLEVCCDELTNWQCRAHAEGDQKVYEIAHCEF